MEATTRMPTHHASASQILSDTGCPDSNAGIVLTIAVTGWFSAKTRTTSGIDLVGTNAELIKGRKISGYEKAAAPSVDFAVSPGIPATQVKASVNNARMPTTVSHDWMPADERKPIINATSMMITTEIALDTSEVRTCPHSMVEGAIGMERNRSKIPRCTSVNKRRAV